MNIARTALYSMLFVCSVSYAQSYMLMPIDSVYDGDTIKTHFSVTRLPPPLNKVSVRLRGVDTPEMAAKSYYEEGSDKLGRAKCKYEADLAMEARQSLIKLIGDKDTMKVSNFDWGSYPRRIVADIKINGKDVAMYMIGQGYAVIDDGKTSKDNMDWCL